jgi:hypothetical protein
MKPGGAQFVLYSMSGSVFFFLLSTEGTGLEKVIYFAMFTTLY